MNAFSLLEQMEKNLNTFAMRLKEGYSWHFPELAKLVVDNESFARLVLLIGNKANIKDIELEQLSSITGDDSLSQAIKDRTQSSVGNSLGEIDEAQIKEFAQYVIGHFEYRKSL